MKQRPTPSGVGRRTGDKPPTRPHDTPTPHPAPSQEAEWLADACRRLEAVAAVLAATCSGRVHPDAALIVSTLRLVDQAAERIRRVTR